MGQFCSIKETVHGFRSQYEIGNCSAKSQILEAKSRIEETQKLVTELNDSSQLIIAVRINRWFSIKVAEIKTVVVLLLTIIRCTILLYLLSLLSYSGQSQVIGSSLVSIIKLSYATLRLLRPIVTLFLSQPWHKLKVSGKVDDVLCLGFPRQSTLQSSVISKFFSNLWPLPRRTDMLTLLYGGSRDFLILAIFNLHCLWLPANQSDYRPRIQTWQWWQLVGLEDTEIGSYQQQVLHFMAIWHTEKWPQSCLFH